MNIRGLSCIFPVPDIQRTAGFYVSQLGFGAAEYLECKEPHICLYRDDVEIILLRANTEKVLPNRTLYGYGYDAYLYAEDQALLKKEFEEKGVHFVRHLPEDDLKTIAFEDVSFRYGSRRLVLDGMTMEGKRGQCIALVGESGCGKSTVTKLLQGLYPKEAGRLTINDIPIEELSLTWLRTQIACVPQETFLFADTIRNNLLLGLQEDCRPNDTEIWRVLEDCCCDFVRDMPMGLDSMLEEGGIGLSGGQRQRLAIARALLRKPRLLILDEATSSLDTVTERKIRQMLLKIGKDMLVLIIAHRLSTVREADRIYVLENGHVAEDGQHDELLKAEGVYAQLWMAQKDAD